jgi:TolB protein
MNKKSSPVFRNLTFNFIFFILLWIFPFFAGAQPSEVYLQIRAGLGSGLVGVGIENFVSPDTSAPINDVRQTLIEDLDGSGIFKVASMPDTLATGAMSLFQRWKAAGAACYLVGEPSPLGNTVAIKLYDLNSGMTRLDTEYLIEKNRPWYTAHVIVDDMIQVFTGLRGSFASQIAYISRIRGGNDIFNEIFIVDADGRRAHQLTFSKTLNLSPAWSPGADRIAYSTHLGLNWPLATININTGQSQSISNWGGQNLSPSWCPVNPDLIAFSSNRDGNNEIYVSRANGTGVRRLTNSPGIDVSPSWSPDGSKIAFTSDRTGLPAVYIMESDGSDQHRLTTLSNTYEDSPSWSPRGDRIAFVIRTGNIGADIATVSPSGEDVVMLTMGEGANEDPKWSPDGLRIVFTSSRLGEKSIFLMKWDGTGVRQFTKDGYSYSPSWAPTGSGDDVRIRKR